MKRISRRSFVKAAAIAGAPLIVRPSVLGLGGAIAPSERIGFGLIGRGLMGAGHLRVLLGRKEAQVLAVCDADRTRCEEGRRIVEESYGNKGCGAYSDYRELIARPDIDAVVIVTPDHWHTPMSCHAAAAGKDVYCEKPVSLTIAEGRELVETVRRNGRVFQTGTQYRSIPTIREVCAFVRRGGIGRVKHVFTNWMKTGIPTIGPSDIPLDPRLPAEPVPDGLDWNLWVGPATWRPYNSAYHRNPPPGVVPWQFCDAFGAGAITAYQSHAADVIQYALGMEESGPIEIHHPKEGQFPTLTFRYANGTLLHHVENWNQVKELYGAVPKEARLAGLFGGIFVGERGWVTSMSTGGQIEGGPAGIFEEMKLTTREVNIGGNNHHSNWFECLRTRARPSSHEEIGHRSASLGHLATISYALGQSLKWNPAAEEFQDNDIANRMRSRAKREPWRI